MSEILGKMEKPEASQFKKGRKLFFVPLVFRQMEEDSAFAELSKRYWSEVEEQLDNLQSRLSVIKKVYHELVSGKEGLKQIGEMSGGSHRICEKLTGSGAALTDIENNDTLMEFMDWGKCLSGGLQSPAVFNKVYASYEESGKKRDEDIARLIGETLGEEEAAVIFMREGHHVQFPADIQVFYVSPPGLDALKRAIREQQEALYRSYSQGHKHEAHEHGHEETHEHGNEEQNKKDKAGDDDSGKPEEKNDEQSK